MGREGDVCGVIIALDGATPATSATCLPPQWHGSDTATMRGLRMVVSSAPGADGLRQIGGPA